MGLKPFTGGAPVAWATDIKNIPVKGCIEARHCAVPQQSGAVVADLTSAHTLKAAFLMRRCDMFKTSSRALEAFPDRSPTRTLRYEPSLFSIFFDFNARFLPGVGAGLKVPD